MGEHLTDENLSNIVYYGFISRSTFVFLRYFKYGNVSSENKKALINAIHAPTSL